MHSRSVSHRCEFPQADGQWPPLQALIFNRSVILGMENIKTNSIVTGRAPAKAFLLSVTPNCPCGGVASEHRITVGASIARPLLGAQPIRIKNRAYRFCVSPTGDNGIILFCTRVLFHIAANFHRQTANGRPYGSTILEHRFIVPPLIRRGAVRRIFKCRRKIFSK